MGSTYHIWTIGCQMNEADSRHLSSQLEAIGYTSCGRAEEADLVVLNTCVVRQQAEDKCASRLSSLQHARRQRDDMTIALMGCMVGKREAPRLKERFPFVDVFMPPSQTEPLLEFLASRGIHDAADLLEHREKAVRDAVQDGEHILPALQRGKAVTANVPIVLGCSHACTFCVIPYRRGAERSRPREEVLDEVRALAAQGVREVTLLGQIVDRYGLDLEEDVDLADLLREVAGIPDLLRVRFLTSHPNWMTDRLLDAVAAEEKICPQIEIPFQAGNDQVLENMRRGYTRDAYRRLIDRIRDRLPDAAIHTDIIVGFPGETDDQFMDTYRLLEEVRFEKAHIAKYSERPRTLAARRMPDDVTDEEKERRRKMLDDLQTEVLTARNATRHGSTVRVLVEDRRKGRWRGRTPHGKLVFFEDARDLAGREVEVEIDWTGPFSLLGKTDP